MCSTKRGSDEAARPRRLRHSPLYAHTYQRQSVANNSVDRRRALVEPEAHEPERVREDDPDG